MAISKTDQASYSRNGQPTDCIQSIQLQTSLLMLTQLNMWQASVTGRSQVLPGIKGEYLMQVKQTRLTCSFSHYCPNSVTWGFSSINTEVQDTDTSVM